MMAIWQDMDDHIPVSYDQMAEAYQVMRKAIGEENKNPRTYLIKYLDNQPLPILVDRPAGVADVVWDFFPSNTVRKLELLLGPHGHTVAKAWLASIEVT